MKKLSILVSAWLIFGFGGLSVAQDTGTCSYCDEPGYIQRGGVDNFCPLFDYNDTRPFIDSQTGNVVNSDASYCDADERVHRVILEL